MYHIVTVISRSWTRLASILTARLPASTAPIAWLLEEEVVSVCSEVLELLEAARTIDAPGDIADIADEPFLGLLAARERLEWHHLRCRCCCAAIRPTSQQTRRTGRHRSPEAVQRGTLKWCFEPGTAIVGPPAWLCRRARLRARSA